MASPVTISFCTTCKNRLYQLRETLPGNLAAIADHEEIVLVDYASPDGLSDWVWDNFRDEIAAGKLRFFEVSGQVPWHVAKAKNLAHRLSRGDYLFNLDGDNFLTASDLDQIRAARASGIGCRQNSGDITDGTPGRIGLARRCFFRLGGYDEALLGVMVEDLDLIIRAEMIGYRFRRLGPPEKLPVQNDASERMANFAQGKDAGRPELDELGRINIALAKLRRQLEGPLRRQNFASYRGKINGQPVILDGLNMMRGDLMEEPKTTQKG